MLAHILNDKADNMATDEEILAINDYCVSSTGERGFEYPPMDTVYRRYNMDDTTLTFRELSERVQTISVFSKVEIIWQVHARGLAAGPFGVL